MARIGTNMTVYVEQTAEVAYTNISAITKADPGVVTTATAHGLTTGDVLKWNGTAWVNSTVDFSSAQSVLAGAVFNS